MRSRWAIAAGLTLTMFACAAPALAQKPAQSPAPKAPAAKPGMNSVLTAAEATAELRGVDMHGYTMNGAVKWRECIDKRGTTLYEMAGATEHGRIRIEPNGTACYAYDVSQYKSWGCFRVTRNGAGYIFWGAGGETFHTLGVKHGVETCKPEDALVG